MGIRLINIFGTLCNPLEIRSVSCPEKIETNYPYLVERMKFSDAEPGNWILPSHMEAWFHLTFTNNTKLEVKTTEPLTKAVFLALGKAKATKLKKDWRGRVNEVQVKNLRGMVQATLNVQQIDNTYERLRRDAAKACANARLDWAFAMEEIPVYKYPPETTFKMVPMEATAA